jgi:acetyl esterase/lipase
MQGISRRTFLTLTGASSTAAAYAKRLRDAGVAVKATDYTGVTHEFFGTGAVINKAKQAVNEAAAELRAKFSKRST